jgi:hypothetical protein
VSPSTRGVPRGPVEFFGYDAKLCGDRSAKKANGRRIIGGPFTNRSVAIFNLNQTILAQTKSGEAVVGPGIPPEYPDAEKLISGDGIE